MPLAVAALVARRAGLRAGLTPLPLPCVSLFKICRTCVSLLSSLNLTATQDAEHRTFREHYRLLLNLSPDTRDGDMDDL